MMGRHRILYLLMVCMFFYGIPESVRGAENRLGSPLASATCIAAVGQSGSKPDAVPDRGAVEREGEKQRQWRFPWLLAGLGAAVVITAILLLAGRKKSSPDGNNIEYGTVTDIDGNAYRTVRIGTQWWMAENLKTTRYRNGNAIANVTDNNSWFNLTTGAYCNYNNDENYVATYGRFYNWYAVHDGRNLAPAGWHVSTDADWAALITYLGGEAVAGGYLKEAGTTHWSSPNTGATNESGFTALPGGYRNPDGPSNHIGNIGFWWTATVDNTNKAWRLTMRYFDVAVERNSYYMMGGMSVRCVKD